MRPPVVAPARGCGAVKRHRANRHGRAALPPDGLFPFALRIGLAVDDRGDIGGKGALRIERLRPHRWGFERALKSDDALVENTFGHQRRDIGHAEARGGDVHVPNTDAGIDRPRLQPRRQLLEITGLAGSEVPFQIDRELRRRGFPPTSRPLAEASSNAMSRPALRPTSKVGTRKAK